MQNNVKPSLVILAAGLGSRFGSLKQITPIGDNGELIIDFSIFDAIQAGFKKVVFIIKKENEGDFERLIGQKIRPFVEVCYVYQDMFDVPEGRKIPEERTKPLGTGHAVFCCRNVVKEPFAIINADDYYGQEAFEILYNYLINVQENTEDEFAMVGYRLGNTLTENGFVSRGICEENEQNYLNNITERTKIFRSGDAAMFEDGEIEQKLPLETVVSMNMWAFTPKIMNGLHESLNNFFETKFKSDPLKAEFYLPTAVDEMIKAGKVKVKVLRSPDKWYGVTYKEDRDSVAEAMKNMKAAKKYPQNLWEKTE